MTSERNIATTTIPKNALQGNGLLITQGGNMSNTMYGSGNQFTMKDQNQMSATIGGADQGNPLMADYISEDFLQVLEVRQLIQNNLLGA